MPAPGGMDSSPLFEGLPRSSLLSESSLVLFLHHTSIKVPVKDFLSSLCLVIKKKKKEHFWQPLDKVSLKKCPNCYILWPTQLGKLHGLCKTLPPPDRDKDTAANWDVCILFWILTCKPNSIKTFTIEGESSGSVVKTTAVLPEDLGFTPGSHMGSHSYLQCRLQYIQHPLLFPWRLHYTDVVHRHTHRQNI